MSEPTGTIMRSLLFIPGNRLDMLRKGLGFSSDVVVPDLEDSVPNAEKDDAREKVAGIVEEFTSAGFRVIPRINSLNSGYGKQDLQSLVGPSIWGINVGKTDRPEDILELDSIITDLESAAQIDIGTIKLIPYIENEIKANQTTVQSITRHTFGLFTGIKGSKYWKRYLNRIKFMEDNVKNIILNGIENISE